MKLHDIYSQVGTPVHVKVSKPPASVRAKYAPNFCLAIRGYETAHWLECHGVDAVVAIQNREGVPHVVVWADITQEAPTHVISLTDARASKRPARNAKEQKLKLSLREAFALGVEEAGGDFNKKYDNNSPQSKAYYAGRTSAAAAGLEDE